MTFHFYTFAIKASLKLLSMVEILQYIIIDSYNFVASLATILILNKNRYILYMSCMGNNYSLA